MPQTKRGSLLIAVVLLLTIAGCTGPLELTYAPTTVAERAHNSTPQASIFISDFTDTRTEKKSKKLGVITATVSDINATELIVKTEPVLMLQKAFVTEFKSAGYTVLEGSLKKANDVEFILSVELRELKLDIGSRDTVSVEAYVELKENVSGSVAWSGVLRESGDRYAGVMGNSRVSINRYLSNSFASLVRSAIAAAAPAMHKLPTAALQGSNSSETDITTSPEIGAAKGAGRSDSTLVLKTEPTGAKIYIDGVYWGTTPLEINFYPGTYELKLKKSGYETETETVGLKRGRTTKYQTELIKTKSSTD